MTDEEKQRAIELGKQLGLEVTFGNEESGIYIGDTKMSFEDLFKGWLPELNELEV
nr:hypothetical protein [Brevibacillus laterosporus]